MSYTVDVRRADATPLAAVQGRARWDNLPPSIRRLFDRVYASPDLPPKPDRGLNVVLYEHERDANNEFTLSCGIQVPTGFQSRGELVRVDTPAGQIATTTYWGAYDGMKPAHEAIHAWFRERGLANRGPSWEIYGHWSDDPSKLRTDICYLVG